MINQNNDFENPECKIQCEFGDAIRELQISKLLTKSNIKGKSGKSFYEVFQFLKLLVNILLCIGILNILHNWFPKLKYR